MKRATAISLAHALAAARTVDDVHDAIQARLPAVVDATVASLGIVDRDAGVLRLRPTGRFAPELAERYRVIPLDLDTPITEVVRTREMLVLPDHHAWRDHATAQMAAEIVATGLETTVFVPLTDSTGEAVAAFGVSWNEAIEVDEPTLVTLRSVAELCQDALERAGATDRAAQRARDLAHLAEELADAMTVEEALEVVTRLGQAPVGAAATSVGLIDHDAGVLRTHHGESVDRDVQRQFSDPPLDAPLAFTDAARNGEAILIEDYDAYMARYPHSSGAVARLGMGARAAVPIRTSTGETMGSMVHAWSAPRTFDEELRSTLTTIAEMAGQAIERAQLLEHIRRDAARHEALAGLAELLAKARTSSEVADVVALHASAVAGADSANVAVLNPEGDALLVHHHPSLESGIQARYATVSLSADIPHAHVLRGAGPLLFDDLEAFGARYPHLLDDVRAAGRQACAVIALPDTSGRALGALGFAWSDPTRLDGDVQGVLQGVARLCAQALERSLLSDAEHRLVTALQDSVLTPLPPLAGLTTAGRYLPAARHIGMGGDWYQGIALDEHRYALVVGDVAGHGITAVGEMAQLQAVISALVRLGTAPNEVFRLTTELLQGGARTVTATALLVLIDTESSTLSYVAAGHPPPLLRTPQGTTILGEGRQPLLGVPMTRPSDEIGVHPFPPGSILVTYTDGLVERRREPIDRSIGRLADHLRAAQGQQADDVADELIAASLAGREPDDDVALVVVHRNP